MLNNIIFCLEQIFQTCNITYFGGCFGGTGTLNIKMLNDGGYAIKQCLAECARTEECAGFFIHNEKRWCHLYKAGCKQDARDYTYYSMKDCIGNICYKSYN